MARAKNGLSLTFSQKVRLCQIIGVTCQSAVKDENTWKHLSQAARATFIRSRIRNVIMDLPEPVSWWRRIAQWLRVMK